MKVAVFDTHLFERARLEAEAKKRKQDPVFIEARLTSDTAVLAKGCEVVCAFANDSLRSDTLKTLRELGVKLIALRSAGFNHVDLRAARELGIRVVRVPEYSPYAVAEHAFALLLALNRKIFRAHSRVMELNFSLDGLVGFDLHGKSVGVVGTGRIGAVFSSIALGFGCRVLAHDLRIDESLRSRGVKYVSLPELLSQSDIVSLHVPLTDKTRHLLDTEAFGRMKKTAILINTGRGALIDTKALIKALKAKRIGGACLDVYEEEEGVFFRDMSYEGLQDDLLARLLTFPNVLITAHQGFLTNEALDNIAFTTFENIWQFENGKPLFEFRVLEVIDFSQKPNSRSNTQ